MSTEAKRLASLQKPSLSLIRQQCSGDWKALRKEAEAQAQRQLDATCRRTWRQMGPSQRSVWQRAATQARNQWERECQATAATADIATSLTSRLAELRLNRASP